MILWLDMAGAVTFASDYYVESAVMHEQEM